jgi:hypothetical protein
MSNSQEDFISKDIDRKNSPVDFYFTAGNTLTSELSGFILRGWAELIENGHGNPNYMPTFSNKRIIYCKIGGKVAGAIMWEWKDGNQTAFIEFTIIGKEFRGRGIYFLLHKYYDTRIKSGGAVASKSQLHINNETIITAAKKDGYEIEYIKMTKRI